VSRGPQRLDWRFSAGTAAAEAIAAKAMMLAKTFIMMVRSKGDWFQVVEIERMNEDWSLWFFFNFPSEMMALFIPFVTFLSSSVVSDQCEILLCR